MVLIIQLRSVWCWLVNEKYTDSDLCKVSVQMTANKLQSWHSESWKQREGPPSAQDTPKELILSVSTCQVVVLDGH